MPRRRIVKRRARPAAQQQGSVVTAQKGVPTSPESLGLKPGEDLRILVVGPREYCSFVLARLGRLGFDENIGLTASDWHAVWAAKALSPKVVISSIDFDKKSGGIDLMRKIEAVKPGVGVILTSTALDEVSDERSLRDFAWSMSNSWSYVTRRKTDNGDPLGIAIVTAEQGVGWIDYPVRAKVLEWRNANQGLASGPALMAATGRESLEAELVAA